MNTFSKSGPVVVLALSAALLTGCFGKSAQEELSAANASRAKGDKSSAFIHVKTALQKNPDMVDARVLLARLLYEQGEVKAAGLEIEKASKLGASETAVAGLQARLLLAQGKPATVVEQFAGKKLSDTAEQADLLTTLAMAYGAEHKVDLAVESITDALKLDPSNRRAQLVRIRIVSAQSGFDAATREIDAYLARQPKDSEAWQIKGEFAAGAGKRDEAISAYRQAVVARKRNLAAQSALIRLLLDKKDLVAAAQQVKELQSVAGKNLETEYLAAALALASNNLREANERIQRVVKVAGEDPRVMQLAATIDLKSGALVEADALLGKLMLAEPNNTTARLMQAQLQLKLGDAAKAEATLQPLLEGPNPGADALALAAEVQASQGDLKSADEYLLRVAKLRPSDTRVRVALAVSAIQSGKVDKGVSDLRAIAASDPAVYAEMALVNFYQQRRDFAQALAVVDAMERKFPGRAGVAALHGRINAQRGEDDKARADFERALKIDPQYYPAMAALVALDASTGRVQEALNRLQPFVQANPKHVPAQLSLIALRDKAGAKPADTVQALRALVSQAPADPAPRQVLIDYQLEHKSAPQALASAQDAVAALPDNAELWLGLGQAQIATGAQDQAITALNKVISLRPQLPTSYMPLAELYAIRKDVGAAMRVLDRALGVKPDFVPALIAKMQLVNAQGKKAEALKIAGQVQTQQPLSPIGLVMAGDIEADNKSWDAAAQNYRAALAKGAGSEVAIKLDIALMSGKHDAESAKFEAQWMGAHDKDVLFAGHLGTIALARGDYDQAEAQFRAVLKVAPDNLAALNNLAWALGKQHKPGALEAAEKVNAMAPNQPSYMDTLASVYAQSGQLPKAIEIQKKALALDPENHPCRLNLARYYAAAGQKEEARKELTKLAALGDKVPQQQEARKLLSAL